MEMHVITLKVLSTKKGLLYMKATKITTEPTKRTKLKNQ